MVKANLFFIALVILAVYMVPQPAHAYIDPSTGSYALQGAYAALFALSFYAKTAWNWMSRRSRPKSQPVKASD